MAASLTLTAGIVIAGLLNAHPKPADMPPPPPMQDWEIIAQDNFTNATITSWCDRHNRIYRSISGDIAVVPASC